MPKQLYPLKLSASKKNVTQHYFKSILAGKNHPTRSHVQILLAADEHSAIKKKAEKIATLFSVHKQTVMTRHCLARRFAGIETLGKGTIGVRIQS